MTQIAYQPPSDTFPPETVQPLKAVIRRGAIEFLDATRNCPTRACRRQRRCLDRGDCLPRCAGAIEPEMQERIEYLERLMLAMADGTLPLALPGQHHARCYCIFALGGMLRCWNRSPLFSAMLGTAVLRYGSHWQKAALQDAAPR